MKRLVEVKDGDGLEKLLGEYVQLWCLNYIYAGKLVGVNEHDVVLAEPKVVYETGKLDEHGFKLAEDCGVPELFVRVAAIESYALVPQTVS